MPPPPAIGILNEAPLHAALKAWYAVPGAQVEVMVDGYVIDLVQDGVLVEIQTGNFGAIRRKLTALTAAGHPLRLVYPVAREKWIVRQGATPDGDTRRRSSRRGMYVDLFRELVSFPRLMLQPNFALEVLLIEEAEFRRYDGRSWRRRGWATDRRELLGVLERRLFQTPADLLALLPESLADPFTAGDVVRALGVGSRLAGQVCYCLREMEAIRVDGRRGRAYLYWQGSPQPGG